MLRSLMKVLACALTIACAAQIPAYAASSSSVLTVETVLSPAWLERANGRREPLAVGMAIANKDKVHTGVGGRAMLRMAEGSAVKLGESAALAVDDLDHNGEPKTGAIVRATLEVVRGAFRFTTGLLARPTAQRDVRVKVNAVTAGIRGTDVWGKSAPDRDVVCLLEGRISVDHGAAQFTMEEPMSFYIAPRTGQAAQPSPVSPDQVRQWSAETEIDPRTGAARRGGTMSVTAASSADERSAAALREKLRTAGFPAELTRATAAGATRYDVRIGSLPDAVEASTLAQRLQSRGYPHARVTP